MSSDSSALPDFRRPPLVEVALSVQFEPVLHAAHLGLLWGRFRARFPRTEEQPPLLSRIEEFGAKPKPQPEITLEHLPLVPRCWFLDEAGTELIQVQRERFVHNWRKTATAPNYPRYSRLRESFEKELRGLEEFIQQEGLGNFRPNQCEITYVNHICSGEGWQRHGEMDRVVALLNPGGSDGFLKEPERVNLAATYLITDASEKVLGRLYVTANSAFRNEDNIPIFVLQIVGRGAPNNRNIAAALEFLDVAHEWAVRAFASTTSPIMHKIWERHDAA